MRMRPITLSAAVAIALAALPSSAARAQYYYPPCSPFPLFWPFCAVGAVVGTAATIVTAPIRALTPPPPYYGYYPRPAYAPPAYYPPGYPVPPPPYYSGPR